jgi:hypothetical protein
MRALALLLPALVAACDREPKDRVEPAHEVKSARRVIEPPAGIVRALPPHLISAAGVGPYRLGDRLSDLLQQLPSGPRIAMFEIPGVLHRSLLRAEEGDSVRIGGEPNGTATSVAVVDAQVARTESGIHVGSTRAELAKSGPLLEELGRAHDPRLAILASPRGMRVLFDPDRKKDRIAAIVLTTEVPVAQAASEPACPRPPSTVPDGSKTIFGACFTGGGAGEQVVVDGNEISIRGVGSDKPINLRIPANVVFAAPLRVEGRDELVVVTRSDEPSSRTWSLLAYRFEGGKLSKTADAPLYSLSATNARWIGAELAEIDLYLELTAGNDSFEVGGLLTTRADLPEAQAPWRDVVVISTVPVQRRHEKPSKATVPSSEESGSGNVLDASSETDASKP